MTSDTDIPCPFVYANGKKCDGHVYRWHVYGPGHNHRVVPYPDARKVRLWCSNYDDHAGAVSSFEGKERMEFYPDEILEKMPELAELIWPDENDAKAAS